MNALLDPLRDEIHGYLRSYHEQVIAALRTVQQFEPPSDALFGYLWFQFSGCFEEHLPVCLTWHDGESGIIEADEDPILDVVTRPWELYSSPNIPPTSVCSGTEVETAVTETFFQWVLECWIASGGRSHPTKFFLHDYGGCVPDLCLNTGEFIEGDPE